MNRDSRNSDNLYNNKLTIPADCGKLSIGDVRALLMLKEKEQILQKYTFPKKAGKDGFFRLNVKDETKKSGRKQLIAKTLEELQDKVYQYEKGITGCAQKTFFDVFQIVQEQKLKYIKDPEKILSAQNTIGRNRSEYRRYFFGTEFEQKFIDEITKKDVENVVYMNLTRYNLRKKGFASMKSILRSVFNLAFEEYWISDNVFQRVNFLKFDGLITPDVPIEQRMHSSFDLKRILDYLHEYQVKKPSYLPAYAMEMQIIMGMRRGEIPPLLLTDIHEDYINISKEQLTVKKNGTAKEHYVIVNHTKNRKNRKFPITNDLREFLTRYMKVHNRFYSDSRFLFPANNENGCITNCVVYDFYYRMCKKLGISVCKEFIKGTHSFRRNAITDVVNSTNGNIILASQLFGNTPEVAQKNYFTGTDLSMAVEVLNQRKIY